MSATEEVEESTNGHATRRKRRLHNLHVEDDVARRRARRRATLARQEVLSGYGYDTDRSAIGVALGLWDEYAFIDPSKVAFAVVIDYFEDICRRMVKLLQKILRARSGGHRHVTITMPYSVWKIFI